MKMNKIATLVSIAVLFSLGSTQIARADDSRVLRSMIFPGMGQLSDGQTAKGLLYMVGEVALLTLTIDNISKASSNARGTVYDSVYIYDEPGRVSNRSQQMLEWQKKTDTNQRAKTMALSFGGLALAWWAWNVVDGILFVPKNSDEMSLLKKTADNASLSFGADGAALNYSLEF